MHKRKRRVRAKQRKAERRRKAERLKALSTATATPPAASKQAADESDGRRISLRTAKLDASGIEIDRDAMRLRNVSIITRGPALGHGFEVDDVMLEQVATALQSGQGTTSRLTHVEQMGGFFGGGVDALERMIGAVDPETVSVDDGQVRGDIQLGKYAANVPGLGNVADYLLDLAEEAPERFGLSIVFEPDEFVERSDDNGLSLAPLARVSEMYAVDFVGDPAANPGGLLSSDSGALNDDKPTEAEEKQMERLKERLRELGLDVDGLSDAEILEMAADHLQDGTEDEDEHMQDDGEEGGGDDGGAEDEEEMDAKLAAAKKSGVALEAKRQTEIRGLGSLPGVDDDLVNAMITNRTPLSQARKIAIQASCDANKPLDMNTKPAGGDVKLGANRDLDTLAPAMADAIARRSGRSHIYALDSQGATVRNFDAEKRIMVPKVQAFHERSSEFTALSLTQMFARWLVSMGAPAMEVMGLGAVQLADLMKHSALKQKFPKVFALAQGTGFFDNIAKDAINKTLRAAYEDHPRTWNRWARRTTAPDFKDITRAALSEVPDMRERGDGGGLKYVEIGDTGEVYRLEDYSNGVKLTRRAIINDDLDAFSRVPMLQGSAAGRLEEDLAYDVLITNPAMSDGEDFFSAAHGNTGTLAFGDPGLNEGWTAVKTQKGPKGSARLDIEPNVLVVPVTLEQAAWRFVNSVSTPDTTNEDRNFWNGRFDIVGNSRLDDDSATQWYMGTDPNRGGRDGVEVCFLESEQAPQLEQKEDFDTGDMLFKVTHVCAAAPIDHRTWYRSTGAG